MPYKTKMIRLMNEFPNRTELVRNLYNNIKHTIASPMPVFPNVGKNHLNEIIQFNITMRRNEEYT